MMFELWMKFGHHQENALCGRMVCPESEVVERVAAVHKLGGELWLVRPLDNDEER